MLLLIDNHNGLKIIYLVRDPRAVIHSRKKYDWCMTSTNCINPQKLCQDMVDDFKHAKRTPQEITRTHLGKRNNIFEQGRSPSFQPVVAPGHKHRVLEINGSNSNEWRRRPPHRRVEL